jgi:hypothetical protein
MKNILLSVCILICFAGCKKHSDTQSSSSIHVFKGILVTNDIGEVLGTWGTEDGDWGTDATWSAAEYELLNFPDTISLDGTYIMDTTGWNIGPGIHEQPQNSVFVFPNPSMNYAMLEFHGLGLLKFKAAIVDKYYNRMKTYVNKTDGLVLVTLDFSDSIKFQNGVYRMFYSLSAKDSLNFYKGHGDILICRENNWQDCKKMVP